VVVDFYSLSSVVVKNNVARNTDVHGVHPDALGAVLTYISVAITGFRLFWALCGTEGD
jgi:hypothetical protein